MYSFAVAMSTVKSKKQNKQQSPSPQNFKEKYPSVGYSFIITMKDVKAVIVHL